MELDPFLHLDWAKKANHTISHTQLLRTIESVRNHIGHRGELKDFKWRLRLNINIIVDYLMSLELAISDRDLEWLLITGKIYGIRFG